ncbi:MAG TPA: 6-phosphogluconolactonase [Candidatus Corynebacterium gallistercoris]|uniref:6-phosphogluconolactonase n=1 Tax=Candidatus Corynebacterium gallistercoris TaxID=2838530 RepID=A0A9D1S0R2_9CORY|nr:6-phosphogluconolactonase [Candidatus Corynebacterium gallistercoris]
MKNPQRDNQPVTNPDTGVELRVKPNQAALASAVARAFLTTVAELQRTGNTVTDDGMVRVVLTGGGAGIATLAEIAALDHAAKHTAEDFPITAVDWSRVYIFFGDERFLPSNDPERNDKQAVDVMLRHLTIPNLNIYRYPALQEGQDPSGSPLDEATEFYRKIVDSVAPGGFDLHLLGMGPEGHVNSLFPHSEALLHAEGSVVAVRNSPKPPAERISLTMSAINSAQQVWMLVCGEAKKEAAGKVFRGGDGDEWPAARALGKQETVLWVDEAANPNT